MFKRLSEDDKHINTIETNTEHQLDSGSEYVYIQKGYKNSSNSTEKNYWYSINRLFYDKLSYSSDYMYQDKNLQNNCKIISIDNEIYGNKINKDTVKIEYSSGSDTINLKDDGNGNLYDVNSSSIHAGNVFYSHGISVITNTGSKYQYIGEEDYNVSFESVYNIYEHSYMCRLPSEEFNGSMNPSFVSGSNHQKLYDDMPTFITTIGLYDDNHNLLAIGRLARPVWNDPEQDLSVEIQFDL